MAVIMAFAGSAIGLGNLWRFPYLVGQDGGAAFIVVYILSTIIISLPIFLRSPSSGAGAERTAAERSWPWLRIPNGASWAS